MEDFVRSLTRLDNFIWQPLYMLLLGTGLFLTFKLKGFPFRYLWYAHKLTLTRQDKNSRGDISHFQALMTALAATIGIGNIVGVATAIAIGGCGALFWLWVTALIGLATKYSEALLAIKYRIVDKRGEMAGGPMYYLKIGVKSKWLAIFFSFFGAITAFFTGNLVQSNSIAAALQTSWTVAPWITGLILTVSTGLALLGGIKSIGKITSYLVPFMAFFYVTACLIILCLKYDQIPHAIGMILTTAFTGQAALGGFLGSTILIAVQMGVSRGIFSNESGLGSASIAAAAAKTDIPGRQALISMTGAFLSTVVCTFTGLALIVSDVLGKTGPDGSILNGAPMTIAAFELSLPFGNFIVIMSCILFGYSTIIGWAYYGEKCSEYLFGTGSIQIYRVLYTLSVLIGVFLPLEVVWGLADITNAFMALPNLIGIFLLSKVITQQTEIFLSKIKSETMSIAITNSIEKN